MTIFLLKIIEQIKSYFAFKQVILEIKMKKIEE